MPKRKQFDPAKLDAFIDKLDVDTNDLHWLLDEVRADFQHVPSYNHVAIVGRYAAALADLSNALFGKIKAAHERQDLERRLREEHSRQLAQ